MEYKKGDIVEFKLVLNGKEYTTNGEIFIYKSDIDITLWKVEGLGGGKFSQVKINEQQIIKKNIMDPKLKQLIQFLNNRKNFYVTQRDTCKEKIDQFENSSKVVALSEVLEEAERLIFEEK